MYPDKTSLIEIDKTNHYFVLLIGEKQNETMATLHNKCREIKNC